jgi:DtxR family Mn-dependent transcriptional regulator
LPKYFEPTQIENGGTALTATLTASLEDYLEAIFLIISEKDAVRPKDLAARLRVTGASVTGALRSLALRELINYAPYDEITLTSAGMAAAKDVVRRHEVLRDFFVKVLAVEESHADQAACRMEHSIPRDILERFVRFVEFVDLCPRGGTNWIEGFNYQCDHGQNPGQCEKCVTGVLEKVRAATENKGEEVSQRLRDMKPGQKGKVSAIGPNTAAVRRMVEMGVTKGTLIEVERIAPLGDPIEIKVMGYHLSLRRQEADGIQIERI